MAPRWLVCLVVVLAAPTVHAQTAPLPSEDPDEYADHDDGEDSEGWAPYAPPELPAETRGAPPFANAVWASGHWAWEDGQWQFNPGSWLAPMPGYQFINGYWDQDGGGWRWVSGGWAPKGSTVVEIPVELTGETLTATQAPPPPQEEVRPPPPAPDETWTPGYWAWAGDDWVWVSGAWVRPPRPGLVYVEPRWVHRGPSWYFESGGWAVRGSVRVVVPYYRHYHYRHGGWRGPRYHHHHDRVWRAPRYYHRHDNHWRGPRHHDRRHPASPGGSNHRGRGRYRH